MSAILRQKLLTELANKTNRASLGKFFDNGYVGIRRSDWQAAISTIKGINYTLKAKIWKAIVDEVSANIYLQKPRGWMWVKGTRAGAPMGGADHIIRFYFERVGNSKANLISSPGNALKRALKKAFKSSRIQSLLKKDLNAIAKEGKSVLIHSHGRTDADNFKHKNVDKSGGLAGEGQFPGAAGTAEAAKIAKAISDVMATASKNTNNYELIYESFAGKYADIYGMESVVNTEVFTKALSKKIFFQSFVEPASVSGNQMTDRQQRKELEKFLSDPSHFIKEIMKLTKQDFVKAFDLWSDSPKTEDQFSTQAMKVAIKELTGSTPDMRFKVNKELGATILKNKVKRSKKGTKSVQKAKTSSIRKRTTRKRLSGATAVGLAAKTTATKRTSNSTTSLANLMQMINAELPRFLKTNMTPPRLQYRGKGNPSKPFAGPFNTGVQVTSLTDSKSNAGGINVNYTYEKYPYQTFEPGFKQGSTLRDPRELIKESIRQIMIANKQNRFLRFRRH